jgi:hypothetical protein
MLLRTCNLSPGAPLDAVAAGLRVEAASVPLVITVLASAAVILVGVLFRFAGEYVCEKFLTFCDVIKIGLEDRFQH